MQVLQNQTNRKIERRLLISFVHFFYMYSIYIQIRILDVKFFRILFFVLSSDKYFYIFEILYNLYHLLDVIIKKEVIFFFL